MKGMADHFQRLGLPRRFFMSAPDLERAYLARSREVHPDFFQSGGDVERRASLDLSASLNDANAVLRDPFRRAEYLIQLEGGPTAADLKEMPVAFLEEMLELRMAIEEIKGSPDSLAFAAMERQLAQRRETLLQQFGAGFDRDSADSPRDLKTLRQILNATKYVQGLIRDLHAG
jgi:molecular chaperone HscB